MPKENIPLLCNPIYVAGLREPLESVACVLDEQGQDYFAEALRNAAEICTAYAETLVQQETA